MLPPIHPDGVRSAARPSLATIVFLALGLLAAAAIPLLTFSRPEALPQYTARAGRSCNNCHVDPTGWENPENPMDRVCSMSCSVCHVDPTGGGLRTTSGFYYGIQTLPMLRTTQPVFHRLGWWEEMSESERAEYSARLAESPYPSVQPSSQPSSQPTSQPTSQPSDAAGATADAAASSDEAGPSMPPGWEGTPAVTESSFTGFGTPLGPRATNRLREGRYAGLNPDPLLLFGADFRLSGYFGGGAALFIPMQAELTVALHPIDHLTVYFEGAGYGSSTNDGTVGGETVDRFGFHEAFVMSGEWPGNSYIKVGRFLPPFGTRLDDHTAFVRRDLGLDQGRPSSYVSGVEIGLAPNYPYANIAVFETGLSQHALTGDGELGVSGVAGWRDLGWSLGASAYHTGGAESRTMLGATFSFNPWFYAARLPLTYLGEVDWVALGGQPGDRTVNQVVAFHELDYTIRDGVLARLRHDFIDPDTEVVDDHINRVSLQFDIWPVRHVGFQLVGRLQVPSFAAPSPDFLAMFRAWL
jgi:hypothetical protein